MTSRSCILIATQRANIKLKMATTTPLHLAAVACVALTIPITFAQPPTNPAPTSAFDVVSIRPTSQDQRGQGPSSTWAIQPDGYRALNQTIWQDIMLAYFPQGLANWTPDRLKNAPAWIQTEPYDLVAKVAPADLAAWRRQGNTLESQPLLRAMLQSLLADRCKLVVHAIPAEVPALALTVSKRGPQFKPTPPDETIPPGAFPYPEGGAIAMQDQGRTVRFYGVSMERIVVYMTTFSYPRFPIEDRTNLTSRYDITLRKQDAPPSTSGDDDSGSTLSWDVQSLGLELKPIKISTQTLVIDHIERPSEN
jgi:bla regulator protein blaR1